jgi:hypothetical protein
MTTRSSKIISAFIALFVVAAAGAALWKTHFSPGAGYPEREPSASESVRAGQGELVALESDAPESADSLSAAEPFPSPDSFQGWSVSWVRPADPQFKSSFAGARPVQSMLVVSPDGSSSLVLEEYAFTDRDAFREERMKASMPPVEIGGTETEAYLAPLAGMVEQSVLLLAGKERMLAIGYGDSAAWPLEISDETLAFIKNIQLP